MSSDFHTVSFEVTILGTLLPSMLSKLRCVLILLLVSVAYCEHHSTETALSYIHLISFYPLPYECFTTHLLDDCKSPNIQHF